MSQHISSATTPRPSAASSPDPVLRQSEASSSSIAERAYAKFIARGSINGADQEDWFEAQEELRAELTQKKHSPHKSSS
ncbi:MAG: DUF2934 domain-containing protein [Deltaproteobacteria bacterium]|nr:DUF2934 domain-containing protein [Deltaproteobacteria bacterium]MBK8011775.1 DUF2934 domain-containing protein [Deltaproteobacteria bacterium]